MKRGGTKHARNSPQIDPRHERGLRLRRQIVKLRWMRLDSEADRAALEVCKIECEQPPIVPRVPLATD